MVLLSIGAPYGEPFAEGARTGSQASHAARGSAPRRRASLLSRFMAKLSQVDPKGFSKPGKESSSNSDKEAASSESRSSKQGESKSGSAHFLDSLSIGTSPSKVIDLAVETVWRQNSIEPARITSDSAFARRLYLDLIGRIPATSSELRLFLESNDSQKRLQLIDSLLASEEHAQHLAEVLDALLIGRKNLQQTEARIQGGWMDSFAMRFIPIDLGMK